MDTVTRRTASDAIEMLEADHEKMKSLLFEYRDAKGAAKIEVAERLFEEIELHAKVAKEILYPVLRARSRFEGRRLVRAALREQDQLMALIVSLQEMSTKNGKFTAGMTQIEAALERHIDAEEEDMLPLAERILDQDTETVGERMMDLRLQLAGAAPLG
jgi:hemerythrin-like domain-containing protein